MPDLKALGYTPDTDTKSALFPFADQSAAPPHGTAASYESLEGSILDQNTTGSCTGHGTSQWMTVTYAKAGKALPFRPSPKGIYAVTREYDRKATAVAGQPLAPLTDSGGMPADLVYGIATRGIRALIAPSPLGFRSDIDASNVLQEEKLGELAADASEILGKAQKIDPAGPFFPDTVAAAVEQTGACGIGVFVDSAFQAFNPTDGPLQMVNLQDQNGGGHWICITSFRTSGVEELRKWGIPVGTLIFRGPNSWTDQWGDKGHFEVTAPWLQASCSDCYAVYL
jgi:hypothetical protein